ncbi:MAG: restriction endonuclease [Roseiarcus sp.]
MREDYSVFWFVGLAIALLISILAARSNSQRANREQADRIKAQGEIRQKNGELSELRRTHAKTLAAVELQYKKVLDHIRGLDKIFDERKIQFPWLASAIADLHALEAERDARMLETKKHAAIKAASEVREHGSKRRDAERQFRLMRYRVNYYEKLFPWIMEYIGNDVPDEAVDLSGSKAEPTDDPVRRWLNDAEYQRLSTAQKNQLALDRWKASRRSLWEIGRDYERFIGYNYETLGYDVTFTGAIHGFEDMGRDLIARRGPELCVIQCKYWSKEKTIHEKHIFQLFGSTLEYAFRLGNFDDLKQLSFFGGSIKTNGAKAVLYTSTTISDVAKDAAKKLDVECNENVGMSDYPLVKCNVSMRDGAKIYHLPFDQQYDRTKIIAAKGERYVYTVAEAEKADFRRAWRWRPDQGV